MNEPSNIRIGRLHEVTSEIVSDINKLLKEMHQKSSQTTTIDLADHINRSIIVVARDEYDQNQIVGMAVLIPNYCVSHVDGRIRNLIISKSHRHIEVEIAKQLVQELVAEARKGHFSTIQTDVHNSRIALIEAFKELQFEERDMSSFRLKMSAVKKETA